MSKGGFSALDGRVDGLDGDRLLKSANYSSRLLIFEIPTSKHLSRVGWNRQFAQSVNTCLELEGIVNLPNENRSL